SCTRMQSAMVSSSDTTSLPMISMPLLPSFLLELGKYPVAQQPQRIGDALGRNAAAAIHLGEDAVETELLLERAEAVDHALGRADDELVAQRLLIGDGLEPVAELGAALDRARALLRG